MPQKSTKKKIYFNEPQRMALHVLANIEYHVWGRRTGKSHGLTGLRSLQNLQAMPRSMGFFLFPTYKMGLAQILPNIIQAWEFFGYKENRDFFIGKRAPRKWKWENPYFNPKTYEHVIHWYNGSATMLISQDRLGSSNSVGFDWGIGDEAKFLNYDRIKTETIPALSGTLNTIKLFKNNPRFRSQLWCSDMPILKKSQWILEKSKDVDKDLIRLILYYRKKQARTKSQKQKLRYQKLLDKLRSDALFYSEASILDNIKIFGEKYIRDQKRILPPFEFRTQLLNKRPNKIENGFYHAYDSNVHNLPIKFDNSILENCEYDFKKINDHNNCLLDLDIDHTQPLVIGEDHNADINSLVIGQPKYEISELWFLKSMFIKMPLKFSDLMRKFVQYYQYLPNDSKRVVYYHDSTSIRRSELTEETNHDVVINILTDAGWDVNAVYLGKQEFHDIKYDNWNYSFSGERGLTPKYNKYNCYDLVVAMQQTGIIYSKGSRVGWAKDKSQEHKYFETEETQPHLTDAMDTLKRGCEENPQDSTYMAPLSNIYGN